MENISISPEMMDHILKLSVEFALAIWMFVKSTDYFKNIKSERIMRVFEILEGAVEDVYWSYVRDIKIKSADGKLTSAEIETAKNRAFDQAQEIAASEKMDIIKLLGKEIIFSKIAGIVGNKKRKNGSGTSIARGIIRNG